MVTGDSDQRVTNALLAYKIDELARKIEQWHNDDVRTHSELSNRLSIVENQDAVVHERVQRMLKTVDEHELELDDLRRQSAWWNGANSIAAVIAGIVGWFRQ